MDNFLQVTGSWLPFVVAFLPLLIGLLVKANASQRVKATVMIVLTGIASLAHQVDVGGGILTRNMAGAWLFSIIVSISTYYGVWKPLGVGNMLPEQGLGAPTNSGD